MMVGIPVTTTGSAGSATGSATRPVPDGVITGIGIKYTSQPATADVTVTLVSPSGSQVLFTRTDSGTDLPLQGLVNDPIDEAGAAFTTVPSHPPCSGSVTVAVAQGDAATDAVVVHLLIETKAF